MPSSGQKLQVNLVRISTQEKKLSVHFCQDFVFVVSILTKLEKHFVAQLTMTNAKRTVMCK